MDHSELVSTFLFVSTLLMLISVSPTLAFLSESKVTRWSDDRILSRSTASPLKICSHSDMGIPRGAPGASLMYNLVDLRSRLNLLMRSADLTQLGCWGAISPLRPLHGMSDRRSFLFFLGLSLSDPDDDELSPPTDSLASISPGPSLPTWFRPSPSSVTTPRGSARLFPFSPGVFGIELISAI